MPASSFKRIGPLVGLLTLGAAASAVAQPGPPPRVFCAVGWEDRSPVIEAHPTLEVGATTSGFRPHLTYGLGVRVGKPIGQRFAFEVEFDWMDLNRTRRLSDQLSWFYFLQARQSLAGRNRKQPALFLTYGTAGWIERSSAKREITLPDGRRVGIPHFRAYLMPPIFPIVGLGGQRVISRYAAVRVDAQLLLLYGGLRPATGRFSAGVSIPIGAYRR
jgi:hypothetical protein